MKNKITNDWQSTIKAKGKNFYYAFYALYEDGTEDYAFDDNKEGKNVLPYFSKAKKIINCCGFEMPQIKNRG